MIDQLARAYSGATSRLLIFDYDGVLAPIVDRPEQATPTDEVIDLLRQLSTRSHTKVVVVSGRDHATLEKWLGTLPIDMSGEHGHFIKEKGVWRNSSEPDMTWRDEVMAAMSHLTQQYPGSHIETKQASVVWHYRQSSVLVDEPAVITQIEQVARGRAKVMPGKCVIDVRAPGADKGQVARYWYDQDQPDFVACIGDDVTDESMFGALPRSAWTIKVGKGATRARTRLKSQVDVIELLGVLARERDA